MTRTNDTSVQLQSNRYTKEAMLGLLHLYAMSNNIGMSPGEYEFSCY